ncbi:cell wall hydrolase [Thermosediminibacter litoriperuensis]|uniref:N-acetylmuramoyl-L-alanine amidase n=1 Tax=Thermosediminibacter litoriperuensis TaxID=291989 RepID=A0A5S5AXP8_9FIRM|nr:cell wall hydrolase [Thermosediminibacter litoriperuensis]TYP57600.1 N-acetylmuramoyl-L-alanine amidase [Thermosediminibacter litoriperuensis]
MDRFVIKIRLVTALVLILILTAGIVLSRQDRATEARAEAGNYAVSVRSGDYVLLARLVSGEATGEPYIGQVAVAAVVLNRVKSSKFPNTVPEVIYQPGAFESVSNGQIWARNPSRTNYKAARDALNGWDPTYGSLFFWNPYKRVSPWIWTRRIITQIGDHVFGK